MTVKKRIFTVLLVLLFVAAANAKPKEKSAAAAPEQGGSPSLEEALMKAAQQFSDSLKKGTTIAILGISSGASELDEYMLDEFTSDMVKLKQMKIVTRANLDVIKKEMNFQLSGEVSDETMQQLGAKTGAQTVISGTLKSLGANYIVNMQALSVETAAIQDTYRQQVAESDTIVYLKQASQKNAPAQTMASQQSVASQANSERNSSTSSTNSTRSSARYNNDDDDDDEKGWWSTFGLGLGIATGDVKAKYDDDSYTFDQTDTGFNVTYLGISSSKFALKADLQLGPVDQSWNDMDSDGGFMFSLDFGLGSALIHTEKLSVVLTGMVEMNSASVSYTNTVPVSYSSSYYNYTYYKEEELSVDVFSFGIGADITAVFRFTPHFGIYGGLGLRYEFGSGSISDEDSSSTSFDIDTTRLAIKPTIAVALMF